MHGNFLFFHSLYLKNCKQKEPQPQPKTFLCRNGSLKRTDRNGFPKTQSRSSSSRNGNPIMFSNSTEMVNLHLLKGNSNARLKSYAMDANRTRRGDAFNKSEARMEERNKDYI
ncbi:hypothetical protein CRYUN_Cryun30bG0072300 [Craigia yunnanensis]